MILFNLLLELRFQRQLNSKLQIECIHLGRAFSLCLLFLSMCIWHGVFVRVSEWVNVSVYKIHWNFFSRKSKIDSWVKWREKWKVFLCCMHGAHKYRVTNTLHYIKFVWAKSERVNEQLNVSANKWANGRAGWQCAMCVRARARESVHVNGMCAIQQRNCTAGWTAVASNFWTWSITKAEA